MKGLPFLSKMVYERKRVWSSGQSTCTIRYDTIHTNYATLSSGINEYDNDTITLFRRSFPISHLKLLSINYLPTERNSKKDFQISGNAIKSLS